MNNKQIENERRKLPSLFYWNEMKKEDKLRHYELDLRLIINHLFKNGNIHNIYSEISEEFGKIGKQFLRKLTKEKILKIYEEQKICHIM